MWGSGFVGPQPRKNGGVFAVCPTPHPAGAAEDSNGAGKSTLAVAAYWALTGQTDTRLAADRKACVVGWLCSLPPPTNLCVAWMRRQWVHNQRWQRFNAVF